MSRCRSCNASIRWVVLASGKKHPIDTDGTEHIREVKGGPIRGVTDDGRVISGEASFKGPSTVRIHRSHFATCPQAALHRKDGKS